MYKFVDLYLVIIPSRPWEYEVVSSIHRCWFLNLFFISIGCLLNCSFFDKFIEAEHIALQVARATQLYFPAIQHIKSFRNCKSSQNLFSKIFSLISVQKLFSTSMIDKIWASQLASKAKISGVIRPESPFLYSSWHSIVEAEVKFTVHQKCGG